MRMFLASMLPLLVVGNVFTDMKKVDPPIKPAVDPPIKPALEAQQEEYDYVYINDNEIPVDDFYQWEEKQQVELELGHIAALEMNFDTEETSVKKYKTIIKAQEGGKLYIYCGNVQANQTLKMVIRAGEQKVTFNQKSEEIFFQTSENKAKIVIRKYEYSWWDQDFLTCVAYNEDTTATDEPTTDEPTTDEPTTAEPRTDCRCGMKNSNQRIIGGTKVTDREFPWQVLVSTGSSICGGSVISKRFVLTAAHCTEGDSMIVIPGADNFREGTQVKVTKWTNHPQYNDQTLENDVAVLELAQDLQFDESISPVCLPDSDRNYAGMAAVSSGYGLTSDFKKEDGTDNPSASISNELLKIDQVVAEASVCSARWGSFYKVDQNICAVSNPGKTICSGDSGGPIQVKVEDNYHIIGVSSYVSSLGCTKLEGVYAKVAAYNDWIQGMVAAGDDAFCPR